MEISEQQTERIEQLLAQLEILDPADVPGPAAELARLLGEILERTDDAE